MDNDHILYIVAAAYKNYVNAERELEHQRAIFQYLTDENMELIQAHPMNNGVKWERKSKFRKGCGDCQISAAMVAKKVYLEKYGDEDE